MIFSNFIVSPQQEMKASLWKNLKELFSVEKTKIMSPRVAKLEYPHTQIKLVLRNSYIEDEYYGVDAYESKRMKIILAKYGCRRSYHSLPGHVTAELYPFVWNKMHQCFRIQMNRKVIVHLNSLEEAVVNYPVFKEG